MADDTDTARHALFNEIDDCIERAFAQHGKGSGRVIELTDALIAAVRAENAERIEQLTHTLEGRTIERDQIEHEYQQLRDGTS